MLHIYTGILYSCTYADPSCDFETDLCGWNGRATRSLKWERGRAGSVTAGTGPPGDRTYKTAAGTSYYIYIMSRDLFTVCSL